MTESSGWLEGGPMSIDDRITATMVVVGLKKDNCLISKRRPKN